MVKKVVKCNGCGEMPIKDVRYKCDNCFDFDFCDNCYKVHSIQKKELKTLYSTSHKNYHNFTKIMLAAPPLNSLISILEDVDEVIEAGVVNKKPRVPKAGKP